MSLTSEKTLVLPGQLEEVTDMLGREMLKYVWSKLTTVSLKEKQKSFLERLPERDIVPVFSIGHYFKAIVLNVICFLSSTNTQ